MSSASRDRQLPTRVSAACERCRRNKSRCDPYRPCSLCVRANAVCSSSNDDAPGHGLKRKRTRAPSPVISQEREVPQPANSSPGHVNEESSSFEESRHPSIAEGEADSAVGIAQRIYQLGSKPSFTRTTSAIPGGDLYDRSPTVRSNRAQRRPVVSILGYALPSVQVMRTLLEEYFDSVHWFSVVIYEPKFRPKFESIQDGQAFPSQKGFLLLLSTVVAMGAWYKSHRSTSDPEFPDENWLGWSSTLIQGVGSQLMELMDQASVASVQTCILLGSYHLYHGKPNLSFSLLGATIRTAQALGLHRQPLRGDIDIIEERKRVWWTIYTWDRFASITYGRPLGINDRDCNVTQPIDTYESRNFRKDRSLTTDDSICYSAYQRELNKLYLAASPIIKIIFGISATGSDERISGPQYMNQIMEVTDQVWAWHRRLPAHLVLDSSAHREQSHASKIHQLQALSLQLTFDSLLIIFHRPLLAQQIDRLIRSQPEASHATVRSPSNFSNTATPPFIAASSTSPLSRSQVSSTEQWWDAALRTSKVTEMPQLAQLATDSHLVAFLAMNLFNSAIVMAVLALSDPLSDRAQEVKRTLTKIFRLQELLGKRTQLSKQSNIVLKDVIQMLLQREADAMLGDLTAAEAPLMSVEETLRLPMQLPPLGTPSGPHDKRQPNSADAFMRLNQSLASVQKVFPAAVSTQGPVEITDSREWTQNHNITTAIQHDEGNNWQQTGLQGFNADTSSAWNDDIGMNDPGNGLYWFWDAMWNDSQLQ